MTFRLIDAEKAQHSVSLLCRVLGVTRAGYYAWRQRGPSRRALGDASLAPLIGRVFAGSLETYGSPRVHAELRDAHGIRVGRKRVARLMRQLELEGISRRGKRRCTTIPDPAAAPAADLVGRRFTAARPNELWLADITYLPTREGWLFLAVVLDAYSRRIVGWSMRDDLKAELVVDALGMAVTRRKPPAGVVHHSDRGSQYTSLAFGATLRESGAGCEHRPTRRRLRQRRLRKRHLDNQELIKRRSWTSRDQARLAVFSYIETFYNPRRRHSALGYRSPVEFENMTQEAPADAAAA
jgi:putative transposase